MPAITSLGIGSGLDINSMVSQLVALEGRPLEQMKSQASQLQTQVSSFGKLSSLFSSLQSAASKLTSSSLWAQSVAASSDSTSISIVGGSTAAGGNYAVSVQKLASPLTVASGTAFGSAGELVGQGQLTIELGAWQDVPPMTFLPKLGGGQVIVDVAATDTLQTLRDKINAAGAGVTASIVTDSSGARLSLRSANTGAENAFRIQANDTGDSNSTDAAGLSRFAFDPPNMPAPDPQNPTASMVLKQSAANAEATVNGIQVSSASNDLGTVVEGLTLRLHKQTAADVDISVTKDREGVKKAIQDFATAYNELTKTIADQTRYDPTTKAAGALQGDSTATGLLRQMRSLVNTASGASGTFPRLSNLGLEIQRDGTLSVDSAKLDAATLDLSELRKALANNDTLDAGNNGLARRYATLASQVLGVDGSLTTRTEGLRERLSRNSVEQERLSDRVDKYKARLVAQYTAMDANLSKLNALSSYMTAQLAALSKSSSSD
jgi:flagellar hook-associated protein 2